MSAYSTPDFLTVCQGGHAMEACFAGPALLQHMLAFEVALAHAQAELGIIPAAGGTQRLPRLVGLGRARDIIFTGRIVEAQRREIGIGMALGVPRPQLAVRPMLIGVQVAVLGTVAGLGVGYLVGTAFGNLLESLLPLPVHRTPFQVGVYLEAALLGIAIPESCGGNGMGLSELMILVEEVGRTVAPLPVLPALVEAAWLSTWSRVVA